MCKHIERVSVLVNCTDNQVVGVFKSVELAKAQGEALVKYTNRSFCDFLWVLNTLVKRTDETKSSKVFRIESHRVN